MKAPNPITLIAWLTACLVLGIALAALGISFGNLFALAYAAQFGTLASNLWATVVDVFIVVATLSVLRTSLQKEPTLYPWILVGLTTVISVVFNVWHATGLLEGFMRAIPPLALFLSFHLLMQQLEAVVTRRTKTESIAELDGQIAAKQSQLKDITQTIAALDAEADAKVQTRLSKIAEADATLKDRRAELRDTARQLEDKQAHLKDIEAEIQFAQADRPDRITERRALARLLADKGVPPVDIAAYFLVSPKTIERDLQLPASNGVSHA